MRFIAPLLSPDYIVSKADNIKNKFGENGFSLLAIIIFSIILIAFISWVIWLIYQLKHSDQEPENSQPKSQNIQIAEDDSNTEKNSSVHKQEGE